jgi:PAS domain S-box-containing protein
MPTPTALLSAFQALPDPSVLLSADLRIEAASDAFLAAVHSKRETLLGQHAFDVFPDNPATPDANSVHNLRTSFERVLATGQPHVMPQQRYDVPDYDHPGQFLERHWLPRNTPVKDEQGRVTHILHVVTDVTATVVGEAQHRESQATRLQLLAEVEAHRDRLLGLIAQVPALIASMVGPTLVVELANYAFQQFFGHRELVGLPYCEAVPELAEQGFFNLLDQVYRTGETYYGNEQLAYIDRTNSGRLQECYFNFIYQGTRDVAGTVVGVLIFAYDVTEQVLARRNMQTLHHELAAATAETRLTTAELLQTQQQLQELNRELEARVEERTQQAQAARVEVEQQRARLERLLMRAPAAICILGGAELVFELVNPGYQQLFPGRDLLGRPIVEALPEIENHAVYHGFRNVYNTGVTHQELGILIPIAHPDSGELEDRYFNYIQQARYDEQGHIDGVLVFAFEVTAQVQAQQASAASAHRLQLLTDALPVLIGYITLDVRYGFVNQAYDAWFHQKPADLLGQSVREVVGERAYAAVEGYIARALAGERVDFTACMPYRPGFVKHIYTSYVPDMQHGQVAGFYTLVSDVTEQVLAREQVQRLNEELAAINEELESSNEELRTNHTELVRTQQHLLEAAERRIEERETFYQVFEQTPALIALLRAPEHRFEYVNSAYQGLFPGRQLVGFPLAEALPETVEQGFVTLMDKVYQTGETYYGSEQLLTINQPDGQAPRDMYFTFTYQAYRENGAIAGVSIFAFEVTEQVLARQGREQERQRLLGLFTQAPAGICILAGPELVFEFVNPGYQLLLSGRELLGLPLFEALPEIVGTPVEEMLRKVYTTGQAHEERSLLVPLARAEDGELENRYFTFVYQPRRDEQGLVDGILVFVFEVTAQQQAIAAVRESESRFRIMADAAPNQVWAVNPDTTIRYANQAFLDFVGMSLEDYVATGWSAYVPPQELEVAQHTLAEAIRTGSPYSLEHRMRRHDGEYRWLLSQGAPSFYPNGELYGYVGSAIDITELKQANEQLRRTNQDLDNFVYAASHDLKQPVNNLAGLFEEVRRASTFTDPAEEELLVPMVQDALQQFSITIDDLAALGQAQQFSHAPAELVSLADLTEEVVNTLEPQARAVRARITTDFAARPALSFARANLRTILLNLLGNSLKYADPTRPARIHISMWVERDQPVLVVEDNGLGFDAAKYGAELFHLFRRLHTHTAGTGVGLYLVNRIVEASGGSIEVDSQPGEGATFRIRFGMG